MLERTESRKGAQKLKQKRRQNWVKECSKIDSDVILVDQKIVWAILFMAIRVARRASPLKKPLGGFGGVSERARDQNWEALR